MSDDPWRVDELEIGPLDLIDLPAEIRLMELHAIAGQLNAAEHDLDVRKKLCDTVTKQGT